MESFRDHLETILDTSRTYIITSKWILVITFAVSILGMCFSFVKLFVLPVKDLDLLLVLLPIALMIVVIGYNKVFRYIFKHNYQNVFRSPRTHPNYYCAKKGVGLVITVAAFIFLDSYLKDGEPLWSIVMCTSAFTFLVLLMVVFKYLEDYDLANAFLFASFGLYVQVFTDPWHLIILTAMVAFLCAFVNFLPLN